MSVQNFTDLLQHYGHEVVIAKYEVVQNQKTDNKNEVQNVAIECVDCSDVLLDFDSTTQTITRCAYCGVPATAYACLGGWAGHFCNDHIPAGYEITDRLDNQSTRRL